MNMLLKKGARQTENLVSRDVLVSLKVIKCKVDCDSFNFNLQVSR